MPPALSPYSCKMRKEKSTSSLAYTYPVASVVMNTCGSLYQRRAAKKPMYARAVDGLTLEVEYADTLSLCTGAPENLVTVLALHGAPGFHDDFKPFIEYFGAHNVRLIAPAFPDLTLTVKTKVWRHSAAEKYHYVKDFLTAIGVDKIDLLISHSSSIYPTCMLLCEQQSIDIRAVSFFNPPGHRRIVGMRPAWFTEGSVKVYQNKWGRRVFKAFGKGFLKTTNAVRVKPDSMNNVMLSAQTMRYSDFGRLEQYLVRIRDTGIPMLWLFSENDRLVEKEIFYEMIDIIGAQDYNIQRYDANGKIHSNYKPDERLRILIFATGGHYAFLKYAHEVIQECDQFLSKVIDTHSSGSNKSETRSGFAPKSAGVAT